MLFAASVLSCVLRHVNNKVTLCREALELLTSLLAGSVLRRFDTLGHFVNKNSFKCVM